MLKHVRALVRSAFLRSVLTVATGTALGQIITLAFIPIITRIYGPETFGLQGIFLATLTLLLPISTLGYSTAVVLPRDDNSAVKLVKLSIIVCISSTIAVAILVAGYGNKFLSVINAEAIEQLAFLIPVALAIIGISNIVNQWIIRKRAFVIAAKYTALTSLLTGVCKTGLGHLHPTAITLIMANTAGALGGMLLTLHAVKRIKSSQEGGTPTKNSIESLWYIAKKHRDFPLFRTPQNLLNAFSQGLPILLLASFSGPAAAGQYSLAIAVLAAPVNLVGGAVASVFYPRITEAIHQRQQASAMIIKATLAMAASGLVPLIILLALSRPIFENIFGQEWTTAGKYAQLLAPWIFLQYLNKPAVSSIPALGLQGGLLVYEVFSTCLKVMGLWVGLEILQSDVVAISLFSAFGAASYAWLIAWTIFKAKNFERFN